MAKWKILKRKMAGRTESSDSDDSTDSESGGGGGAGGLPQLTRNSNDPAPKQRFRWTNKQRLLIFASRGITYRDRHLMNSFRQMLAHSKVECKFEKKDNLAVINEIAEMKNCNKVMYFENRRRDDTYMWLANMQEGPTMKFLVQNLHTMEELKFTGNCLRGSRPFLSFDPAFDANPWSRLVKEMFVQTFGTPAYHPRSQPFFDHVFTFRLLDKRIWFRNYQVVEEDGSLVEIGPRCCFNLVKILDGPFSGAVIYTNPHYVAPNKMRRLAQQDNRYVDRKEQKAKKEFITNMPAPPPEDLYADVFDTSAQAPKTTNGDLLALNAKSKARNAKKKQAKQAKKQAARQNSGGGGDGDEVWDEMDASD